ncbi:TBC1 domain family member 15/17 [Augochlora pura]
MSEMFETTEQGKVLCTHAGVVLSKSNTKADEVQSLGTLNIVEYSFGRCIEWKPVEDSVVSEKQDQDSEWSLVNTHIRRTQTSPEGPDSQGNNRTVRILFSNLDSFRIHPRGQQLILKQKDDTEYVVFFQLSNADSFVNSLRGFIKFLRSRVNRNMYLVVDEVQHVLTRSFAELDIIQENTADYVWKFVKNWQDNPYEATMEMFSKVADIWLHKEPVKRPVEEAVADIFNNTLSIEIPHPPVSIDSGEEYEVIGVQRLGIVLPERPTCLRGTPLTQHQWNQYQDSDGRILNPQEVKEVVFRGGIVPNLRFEVWKYLLNYYPWEYTHSQRRELKKKKADEYFMMKLQWKSMTAVQEKNFSGYRDRKSLIGKDVNRTDRTHPYYAGDNNPHLAQLYDILMTYAMYNFDLGYVQGMSDLLSPILFLMDSEVDAFWCFVGFMEKVSTNFEMDQAGMKSQLCQLYNLLSTIDLEFASYLCKHDSGNMFFCFRWLLVLFKREFDTADIMKLWEVLWTDIPCKSFHLLLCTAILDKEKHLLMENNYGFTDILKHINNLSLHIDLHSTLTEAEGIYCQLMSVTDKLPDSIRTIIGIEHLNKVSADDTEEVVASTANNDEVDWVDTNTRRDSMDCENVRLGENEVAFERGLHMSYM